MRPWWAFWRRRPSTVASVDGPSVPSAGAVSARTSYASSHQDEPDGERVPAPAFSGASPDAAAGAAALDDEVAEPDGHGQLPDVDVRAAREALLALVRACEDDRPAQVLAGHQRVRDLGADALELTAFAAGVALGVQLRTAAGHPPDGESETPLAVQAAVAQGEAVAARASAQLRAVAPHVPRDTVRRLVGLASGVQDDDVVLVQGDVPQRDQLLVCCVLLGQALRDGGDRDDVALAVDQLLGD